MSIETAKEMISNFNKKVQQDKERKVLATAAEHLSPEMMEIIFKLKKELENN